MVALGPGATRLAPRARPPLGACPDAAGDPPRVELVADLTCPWCRLALERLARLRASVPFRLAWRPLLLDPHLPSQGMRREAYLAAKLGSVSAAGLLHRKVVRAAAGDGVGFAFERIRRQPSTMRAHALLLAADETLVFPLARRLYRAFFEDGLDIGDATVLHRLVAESGGDPVRLDAAAGSGGEPAVNRAHREACRLGVDGLPTVLIGRRLTIAGAQPLEVLQALLELASGRTLERR